MHSEHEPPCFGTVVAEALSRRGISRAAFARQVGIPCCRIAALVYGHTSWLTPEREAVIELALGLPAGLGRELHTSRVERLARVRAASVNTARRLHTPRSRAWRKGMQA